MNETSQAFDHPHARASATHDGPPLDRISVRDYVRSADIGAFRPEHGREQRLRFNVVLEVSYHAAAENDDVDQVISYDMITEGIDAILSSERLDLLETLAERIARHCLSDRRAVRVFVRVEKLDRIPGSLGVEIMRMQSPDVMRLHSVDPVPNTYRNAKPCVVYVPYKVMEGPEGRRWRDAIAAMQEGVVLVLSTQAPILPATTANQRRIGLLQIEQMALSVADRDPRFSVVDTRTELDWAIKEGRHSIWAPARMIDAARQDALPDASAPIELAKWLCDELHGTLHVIGADAAEIDGAICHNADQPQALSDC